MRKKIIKAASVAVAVLALTLGLAACGQSQTSAAQNTDPTINVMLDWTPNTNHVGLYAAKALGYYKDEGINVNILPVSSAGAEQAVETGVANIGFSTLSNVAAFDAKGAHLQLILDLTQKDVAIWCALASNKSIKTPKDFSGKTFVTFGSAEQKAVLREMIKNAGGTGQFSTITVGTSTFQTLESGKGTFGGFYATWEGVESQLNGPKLTCFKSVDWGVPGNPTQLGYAVNASWEQAHEKEVQEFVDATARGYAYAIANPIQAAHLLVQGAKPTQVPIKLAEASMEDIINNNYWGNSKQIAAAWEKTKSDTTLPASELGGFGNINFQEAQSYLDFLWKNGVYDTQSDPSPAQPSAQTLGTNQYVDAK